MSYIDDKLEQSDLQSRKAADLLARASLTQLCNRFRGPRLADLNHRAPRSVLVYDMLGSEETWELDGDQHGTKWKDKKYKRIK